MSRRSKGPLSQIPSSDAVKSRMMELRTELEQLEILLKLAEDLEKVDKSAESL